MDSIQSFEFQGMRTDLGDKLLDVKYFRDVVNFNENDIKGEYTILSSNSYKPFCLLPLKPIFEKKMQKKSKFLKT